MQNEWNLLSKWRNYIALLSVIGIPTLTAANLYFGLKAEIAQSQTVVNERLRDVELSSEKTFADKESLKDIRSDIKDMRSDITEIKTLLKRSK